MEDLLFICEFFIKKADTKLLPHNAPQSQVFLCVLLLNVNMRKIPIFSCFQSLRKTEICACSTN